MKKVLDILKRIWTGFKSIAISIEFLLSFPFCILAVIALASHSFLVVLAFCVWVVACIINITKE